MARKAHPSGQRLVHHTAASRIDLIAVYLHNETSYGEDYADQYLKFLDAEMDALAQCPEIGRTVEGFKKIRVHIVKSRPRRKAHGYRIFYREVTDGIEIIRVLHTRRDWPEYIEEE